jgi:hypothetical protein
MKRVRIAIPSLIALASGIAGAVLFACSSNSPAADGDATVEKAIVATCTATMPPSCTGPIPNYADVTPILEKSCIPCHPGPAGAPQWPLTDYGDIQPWAGVIEDEVCSNAMPPLDGGIAITASDRLTLLDWVQCNAPQ